MAQKTVSETENAESVVGRLHQRGFAFVDDDGAERMGAEVLLRLDDAQASMQRASQQRSTQDCYMAGSDQHPAGRDKSEGSESRAHCMGKEMRDDSKKHATSNSKKATAQELMSLLQLQQFRCALTGDLLTPSDARCDHITPVSQGGSHMRDNLQWVTHQVNRAKGTMTQDEFIAMCIKVAAWATRHEASIPPGGFESFPAV